MRIADVPALKPVSPLWPQATLTRRPGRRRALLVLPDARSPRMLVPTGVPAADRMLRRFSRSRRQRWAQGVLATGIRTGLLELLPLTRLVPAGTGTIEDHVAGLVPGARAVGVLLGPPRANAKPVLQVFGPDGATLAFGKVGHTATTAALVRHEADVLADPRLSALLGVRVPGVIDAGTWAGMDVLLTTVLPAAQSRSHSWEVPAAAIREVAESTGVEWAEVGASTYWTDLVARVRALPGAPGSDLVALLEQVAPVVAPVRLGYGRWHGDWSPWNSGHRDGLVELWDWEQSSTGVPLGLDACHFLVQHAFHDGSDPARALLGGSHVLATWYEEKEAVLATRLLYLLEIMHRYAQQGGGDPGPALAHRLGVLHGAVEEILAAAQTSGQRGRA